MSHLPLHCYSVTHDERGFCYLIYSQRLLAKLIILCKSKCCTISFLRVNYLPRIKLGHRWLLFGFMFIKKILDFRVVQVFLRSTSHSFLINTSLILCQHFQNYNMLLVFKYNGCVAIQESATFFNSYADKSDGLLLIL